MSRISIGTAFCRERPFPRKLNPWTHTARIQRIYVRSLSAETYGNGIADMVHDRVLDRSIPNQRMLTCSHRRC